MDEKNSTGVSVIMCCYNSAGRLYETLKHLAVQEVPENFFWEIILVNNASKDNTVEFAIEAWKKFKPLNVEFRVVNESEPGQMYARKKGVTEANYEYIVFCDDDNWLHKNYIFLAQQVLQKDKRIGAAGGQNLPVTDAAEYPEWFEAYKDKYGLGIPATQSSDVSYKTFVLGAGQITRKSLYLQIFDNNYPSLLNGRNGEQLSTGDDFEYCKRLLLWDYILYYDENLKLQHFIPKERLTIAYRERLMQGIDDAGKILDQYDIAIRLHKKNKHKNKWRLLILAPFRLFFIRIGLSDRTMTDQKLSVFYLSPFNLKADPVKCTIKKFIQHKLRL